MIGRARGGSARPKQRRRPAQGAPLVEVNRKRPEDTRSRPRRQPRPRRQALTVAWRWLAPDGGRR